MQSISLTATAPTPDYALIRLYHKAAYDAGARWMWLWRHQMAHHASRGRAPSPGEFTAAGIPRRSVWASTTPHNDKPGKCVPVSLARR